MLEKTDTPIEPILALFTRFGIEASFLVPTETGLDKSIMDAVAPFRKFLKDNKVHDFEAQGQGTSQKTIVETFFVTEHNLVPTKTSLYRPETKHGDPRVWFYNLKNFVRPYNLLAIFAVDEKLYALNASDQSLIDSATQQGSVFSKLITEAQSKARAVASELLQKLKIISAQGFIQSLRTGDTGVGYTLETLLGIAANSSRTPDYRGIELKAARSLGAASRNRLGLFAQVPDWSISACKSSTEILDRYGYLRDGLDRLNCTVDARKPNSQGLFLRVDNEAGRLNELASKNNSVEDVAAWRLERLQECLGNKHKETFWIKAETRKKDNNDWFRYHTAIHTSGPILGNLPPLLEKGIITMDHVMKRSAGGSAKERGPLFKLKPDGLPLLFPPAEIYDLTAQ